LWLRAAKNVGLALERRRQYGASIHVAYGSYWLPSPIVAFKASSIWGPVGGATRTPMAMWPYLGAKGVFGEILKLLLVRLVSRLPTVRRTWYGADFLLAETENTRRALPISLREDTRVINRAALQIAPARPANSVRKPYILFPSRLQPRKGARLAIHALTHAAKNVKLVFVADGMERRSLEALANRLGVSEQVAFRGWIEREAMFQAVYEAAAVLLTGMREEGGCALSEAMQLGTPVIVLGVGGAKLLAETNLDPSRVSIVEPASGGVTAKEMGRKMTHYVNKLHPATEGYLDRGSVEQQLLDVVAQACERSGCPLAPTAVSRPSNVALTATNTCK
ncbi:MAG: glycosyltransferase, partial [Aeoliella sp.]